MAELIKDLAIEILEKEKTYMLAHGGDIQASALVMAINAINENKKLKDDILNEHLMNVSLLKELEKLEKIEEIINKWNNDASHSFNDMCKINSILKGDENK